MASTKVVDFSLRKSKSIERELVFAGLQRLANCFCFEDYLYIGFGSVWFVDHEMAHRRLGTSLMVSIEQDPEVASRARFNRPFKSIDIVQGQSSEVINDLLVDPTAASTPWIVWLDYDEALDEEKIDETMSLITSAPDNSILITTFNCTRRAYGNNPRSRPKRLEELFGTALTSDDIPTDSDEVRAFFNDQSSVTSLIASSMFQMMQSEYVKSAREGSLIPAFVIPYQDGVPMLTLGWVIADDASATAVRAEIASNWPGFVKRNLQAPHLTHREIVYLRSRLPDDRLTNIDILAEGIVLTDAEFDIFCDYYRLYPTYLQSVR